MQSSVGHLVVTGLSGYQPDVLAGEPLSNVVSFSVNGGLSWGIDGRVCIAYSSAFDGLCF